MQVIAASIAAHGRALPLAFTTFEYETIDFSQNKIERDFFISLQRSIGKQVCLVFIMDRGYAKSEHIEIFNETKQLYIIRACSNVIVELSIRNKIKNIFRKVTLQAGQSNKI